MTPTPPRRWRVYGLPVILRLEKGASFDSGIFGNLEYIPYDCTIDEAFIGVIEGINFIRAQLSAKAPSGAAEKTVSDN